MVAENRGESNGRTGILHSRLFLVFFVLAIVLLVFTLWIAAAAAGENRSGDRFYPYVMVEQLSEKPEGFFTLANPESGLLQALLRTTYWVEVNWTEHDQIGEMITAHGTHNVEFNSSCYEVFLGMTVATVDYPPLASFYFLHLSIAWFLLGICVVIAVIIVRIRRH